MCWLHGVGLDLGFRVQVELVLPHLEFSARPAWSTGSAFYPQPGQVITRDQVCEPEVSLKTLLGSDTPCHFQPMKVCYMAYDMGSSNGC